MGLGLSSQAQYCAPAFSSSCTSGDYIDLFTTTGGATNITTNLSSGCNVSTGNYIYHSTATVSQVQGQSVSFSVQAGPSWGQGHRIWVDWNGDQDFSDPGEDVWNSSTSGTNLFTGSFTVPLSVSPGVKRMRVRCSYAAVPTDPCSSQSFGEAEDFNFLVLSLGPCQATPFVGNAIASKAITCPAEPFSVAIDTMTFGSGQHYQWQISTDSLTWANMPNDTNISLNTAQTVTHFYRLRVICGAGTPVYSSGTKVTTTAIPLAAGTYTINGGLATGGTNYNSFGDFKQAIICAGIAGPVVLNVINKGSAYAEQVDFGVINGASATNTITINGNGQTLTSAGGTVYPTLRFNGSSYIKINNLTIEGTGTTNSWGVQVTGGSSNLEFDSVTVKVNTTVTTSLVSAFVINGSNTSATGSGISGSNIVVKNSTIEGGYYGFVMTGVTSGTYQSGNVLQNSTVKDFYLYGVYCGYQDSASIVNNDVNRANRSGTISTFYGVYVFGNATDINVSGNKIHGSSTQNPTASYTAYPFFFSSANATAADPMMVTNNAVYDIQNTGTVYAVYLSSGSYIHFYHNTVSIDNQLSTSTGTIRGFLSFASATGDIVVKNNLFSINHGGSGQKHLIYLSSTTPTFAIDNNHYNMANAGGSNNFGYWSGSNVSSFTAWQAVNSAAFDQNGVYGDPIYDATKYTPQSAVGNAQGANLLTMVPTDINGVARTATPDIGAVEYTPLTCLQPNILGGMSTAFTITIDWQNDVAADSVRIEYGGAGFVQGTGTAIFSTDSTITITGLNSETCYDFYFQTWCGGLPGNGQSFFSICTKCAAKATPFLENFDGITASNSSLNPGMPDCWAYWKSPNHTGYAYTYSFATPYTTPNHVRFYSGATTIDTLSIISPAIVGLTNGDKRVKFWAQSGSTIYDQRVIVGTTASPEAMNTLVILDTIVANNTYAEYTVYLDSANGYNGTHDYVVLMQGALNGTFQSLYIDDVLIEDVPSCNPPTSVTVPTITASGASVAWTSLSGTCFDLEYGPQGFIQGTGNGTLVTNVTTPHAITGLTPNTFYDVYVRDCCNPNAWTGPVTFKTNCLSQLSGTYTIGGTAGATNFATLDSAINVLTGCGVSGPVTFNFQGSANKPLGAKVIGIIQGASATNTVTFNGRGPALDSVLFGSGTAVGFTFDGAKYITFKNMTVNGAGTERTIWMLNNAQYLTFDNCHLWNSPITTGFNSAVITATATSTSTSSSGNNASNLLVKDCKIIGGNYGISVYGSGTSALSPNFTFLNNEFVDQYSYGIGLGYVNNVVATGNDIDVNRSTFAYGFYAFSSSNFTIKQNQIFSSYYGLYFSQVNTLTPLPTMNSEVSNNFIGGGTYGIYCSTFGKFNMYHNTVRGGTYGYYSFGTNPDLNFRNNIFVGGSNYAWYSSTALPTGAVINYNLYFTTGSNIAYNGAAYATLAAWQTAQTGYNTNSLSGDPGLLSNTDFHIVGTLPNDVGLNGLATVDIDGDTRPMSGSTVVDMGADEFTPLTWDASLEAFMVPLAGCGDSAVAMSVVVKNFGLNTITSLPITVAITGGITTTVNTTATVNIPVGATDTIAAGTFNSYAGAAGVNFMATVALAGDQKSSNDSLAKGPGTYIPFEPLTSGVVDTVCANGDSVDLYATYIPGTRYAWYDMLTGGTKLANGDTLRVPSNGPTTYYVAYDSPTANPQVGTGTLVATGTTITPYKTFWMDGRSQYLILASEMAALGVVGGGEINSLAFDVVTAAAQVMNDFTIKMGGTSVTAMTSAYQPTAGMTTCYSANTTVQSGWNVHTFTTPFIWNGVDNIIVEVCFDNNVYTTNSSVRYTTTPFQSTTDANGDLTSSSGCTPGLLTPSVRPDRPNMQLNMKTIACSNIRKPVMFAVNSNTAVAAYGFTVQPNGADVDFNASASVGDTYDWIFGDGNTGTGMTVTHTYATAGTYTACLIVTDSVCNSVDSVCQTVTATIGIEEGLIGQTLNLYPNPNDGKFRVEFQVEGLKNVEIRVMSLLGEVLYSNKPGNVSGTYREEIDLSNNAAGVYILQILSEDGTVSRRVTVRK